MHFTTVIASLAALAPLASAVGNAKVQNHCKDPVYLWSVGGTVGSQQTIEPGKEYSEPLRHDDKSGGVSLKITTKENGLYDGSPQTNFAYTLDGSNVWYDLSDVFGDPFSGESLVVNPSKADCPNICWASGVSPGASQTKTCTSDSDVTLTLCSDKC
ncbi:hypothetical protein NUU61_001674 [Penicillium alfredii]|uniref:Blastomyces yeast-phase-specific protein n=1 Tax=Penicillium alfredii TaxID=1506179 RepID=A0A9W9KGJ6_9EURO|nr:uncharacterized protein NUU61_001674 [Penicillium alfredii]KAJ5104327.1 hypothetical protein NUU61_001674 [Penicillium alfredii]